MGYYTNTGGGVGGSGDRGIGMPKAQNIMLRGFRSRIGQDVQLVASGLRVRVFGVKREECDR